MENEENTMVAALKEEEMEEIDQKDDGYIELVLRVLARMCDGQHSGLQVENNSNHNNEKTSLSLLAAIYDDVICRHHGLS